MTPRTVGRLELDAAQVKEARALARARAALYRLEADWRERIERMDQILETDKGDS